jgi:predicted TIM-barrel fold metal-dependent hydrolase
MGGLREETREKILGLNAARIFGIEVPAARQ